VGNLLTSTDELGRVTKYSYDADNRLIKTTDALNQERAIGYDALGNIVSSTDELGRTTVYTYDKLDRQTVLTDALGHATTYTYDAVGNRTQITDALGQTTKYVYDTLNRQTKVIDAKGGITKTGYDAVGNLLNLTDTVGNITSYSYDELNRQISDTNSLGKTRSFGYDAVGNQINEIDRNGRKRTYNYDALYRQTAEHWLDNLGTDIRTFNYSYDAVGHLLDTNDPDSHYRYSYDAVDRITSVNNLGTIGVPNVLLNYGYDAAGNLLSVIDQINGVQKGANAYSYDVLNRATRITQSGTGVTSKRVDLAYDAASQMTGLNRYRDLAGTVSVANSSYSYDLVGRLTNLAYKRGTTAINSFNYAYDAANRLTQKTSNDGISNYSYDTTDQLTGSDHSTQTDEAYSYDSNGNRTNGGYGTGTNNQLLTDGKFNYQYDDQGNRTQSTEIATGKVTQYSWDYRNRLTSVIVKDLNGVVIKSVAYTYDVNNRRIGKVVDVDGVGAAPATTERYVYDGNQISLVFDGAGNQTHRYLYGTQIDQVLADETNGTVRWAVTDRLGTVTDVIDSQGQVLNHLVYDSFGKVVSQSDVNVEFRYGFTGRERDEETGLDYYRARYYDSANGRFVSEDPLGFGAGDGNLTRYVGNSPTNYIDFTGEEPTDPLNRLDQAVAGFGNAVTFGGTNYIREKLYGNNATQNHQGGFYQAGEVAGDVVSSLLPTNGFKGAQWAQQAVNGYNKARNIYDRFQDVSDKVGSINNILNGCGGLDDLRTLAGGSFNPLGQIKQPSAVLGINSGGSGSFGNPLPSRHDMRRINKKSQAKDLTHVVEPDLWPDILNDIQTINQGGGVRNGNIFNLNGRDYKIINNDHLVPVGGPGIHQLDRVEFKVLQMLNSSGDTPEVRDILLNPTKIGIDPAKFNRVLQLYQGMQ
jgi:RHS repeat-associated protein